MTSPDQDDSEDATAFARGFAALFSPTNWRWFLLICSCISSGTVAYIGVETSFNTLTNRINQIEHDAAERQQSMDARLDDFSKRFERQESARETSADATATRNEKLAAQLAGLGADVAGVREEMRQLREQLDRRSNWSSH